jgi:hypothetical protein
MAVALAAGWSVAAAAPASASCAFVVVRHDRAYFELWRPRDVPGMRPRAWVAGTVEPGCNDTGGDVPAPTRVGARRIAGVSPGVALLVHGQILAAVGYLPDVHGFPLYGPVVDQTPACRRFGVPLTLTGIARARPAGINVASVHASSPVPLVDHQVTTLLMDRHTHVDGLSRGGVPYIGDGQRVRIDALRCGWRVVARHIVAAGPIVAATTAENLFGQDWRGRPSIETSARRHGWVMAGVAAAAVALAGGVLVLRRRPGAARRG